MNETGVSATTPPTSTTSGGEVVRRLNWRCGRKGEPGWINADRQSGAGIDLSGDIRDGLPLESDSVDYVVSVHALQEVPYPDVRGTLEELRRVLRPGGFLRLVLPDLDRPIEAYRTRDNSCFQVPDETAASLSGKMIVHLLWYGHSRMLFTHEFVRELLLAAGFRSVHRTVPRVTRSPYPGIVELDNREAESLFVEAEK